MAFGTLSALAALGAGTAAEHTVAAQYAKEPSLDFIGYSGQPLADVVQGLVASRPDLKPQVLAALAHLRSMSFADHRSELQAYGFGSQDEVRSFVDLVTEDLKQGRAVSSAIVGGPAASTDLRTKVVVPDVKPPVVGGFGQSRELRPRWGETTNYATNQWTTYTTINHYSCDSSGACKVDDHVDIQSIVEPFLNYYRVYNKLSGGSTSNFSAMYDISCDEFSYVSPTSVTPFNSCGDTAWGQITVALATQQVPPTSWSAVGHYKRFHLEFYALYNPTKAAAGAYKYSPMTKKCVNPSGSASRCPWP